MTVRLVPACGIGNKIIDGKQCTICWYANGNKVSQVEAKFNTMIIEIIEKNIGYLFITRVKNHTFLGMYIDLLENNKLEIGMKSYIEEAINFFGENLSTKVSSKANKIIHKVNSDPSKTVKNKSEYFHSNVANILWKTKRLQTDIETTFFSLYLS